MSYFTCNEDGELNTLQFADGMVIMYDTQYQKSLGNFAFEASIDNPNVQEYQGYMPKGWKIATDIDGAVRGVNPQGRNNVSRGTTTLKQKENADGLTSLRHRHSLPVGGNNSTTDVDTALEAGGERLNVSLQGGYPPETTRNLVWEDTVEDLNVPPQTRIAFLVRSVGD